jgi:hypothetical protein
MNNQEKLSSQIEQEAKEKTMEMHVWMKQDLSEEQLQEITGGCDHCGPLQEKARFHSSQAIYHSTQAGNIAGQIFQTPQAQEEANKQMTTHLNHVTYHNEQLSNIMTQINALHSR